MALCESVKETVDVFYRWRPEHYTNPSWLAELEQNSMVLCGTLVPVENELMKE